MVIDHGYAQGSGECCACERCAQVLNRLACRQGACCVCEPYFQGSNLLCMQLPRRQVTVWGILNDATASGLERRLKRSGFCAESVEIACLCLEAYHGVYRSEMLTVRYFQLPEPDARQWAAMVVWIAQQSGRSVTEGFLQDQLRVVASIMTKLQAVSI